MGKTYKDAPPAGTTIEIVANPGGKFDLFRNRERYRADVPEEWLNFEICVQFGYCGEEFEAVIVALKLNGRATLSF